MQRLAVPGISINHEMQQPTQPNIAQRGTICLPLELDWGVENNFITVRGRDLTTRRGLSLVGFTAFDKESRLLLLALSECTTALVYRVNGGGDRAEAVRGNLLMRAKHSGIFGNRISVASRKIDKEVYEIRTLVDSTLMHTHRVTTLESLQAQANSFVDFIELEDTDIEASKFKFTEFAGEPLIGGTNGTVNNASYVKFLEMAETVQFNAITIPVKDVSVQNALANTAKIWLDNIERYNMFAAAATHSVSNPDSQVVINLNGLQHAVYGDFVYEPHEVVVWAASIAAGAGVGVSNVHKVMQGATDVYPNYTVDEIEDLINKGYFVLRKLDLGKVVVAKDINSRRTLDGLEENKVVRDMMTYMKSCRDLWFNHYLNTPINSENLNMFSAARMNIANQLTPLALEDVQTEDFITEAADERGKIIATDTLKFTNVAERLELNIFGVS